MLKREWNSSFDTNRDSILDTGLGCVIPCPLLGPTKRRKSVGPELNSTAASERLVLEVDGGLRRRFVQF